MTSIHPGCHAFVFQLQASYLGALQASMGSSRIRNTLAVTLRTSREEAFLEELQGIIQSNPPAGLRGSAWDTSQRSCLSCLESGVEVVFEHRCERAECEDCQCPPNFCVKCVGQWFMSQQDAHRPERWLEGRSTCAICRKRFCVADIARIR